MCMGIHESRHDNAVSQVNVFRFDVSIPTLTLDYIDNGAGRGVNDDGDIIFECLGSGVKVHAGMDCERRRCH